MIKELLLGGAYYIFLRRGNERLAFLRCRINHGSFHITHLVAIKEGSLYPLILLKKFIIMTAKTGHVYWSYIAKKNLSCIRMLERLGRKWRPNDYHRCFKEAGPELILLEFTT